VGLREPGFAETSSSVPFEAWVGLTTFSSLVLLSSDTVDQARDKDVWHQIALLGSMMELLCTIMIRLQKSRRMTGAKNDEAMIGSVRTKILSEAVSGSKKSFC
jgi:hypothetical protein